MSQVFSGTAVITSQRQIKTLSANLRRLRKETDSSLSKFAEDTGVSRRTLTRIETLGKVGGYTPTLGTVIRIANALQVQVSDVLKTKLTYK